jgi:hypothetical protein
VGAVTAESFYESSRAMVKINDFRFLVVGSGRSGTQYASRLFTDLGIPCGHEALFHLTPASGEILVGDASFGAVAYLYEFQGIILHQVRHPLRVLRSILATAFFDSPDRYLFYYRLIESVLPQIDQRKSSLQKAMYYIAEWNRLCEQAAAMSWRIEDLDAETLSRASSLIGYAKSVEVCATVLAQIPQNVNRLELRGLSRNEVSWSNIPECTEKDELMAATHRYGYSLDLAY